MDWNYDESASMSEKKSADLAGYTPDTPAAAEGSGIERMIIKNGSPRRCSSPGRAVRDAGPSRLPEAVRSQALDVRAALERSGLDHGPISVHAKMASMGLKAPSPA